VFSETPATKPHAAERRSTQPKCTYLARPSQTPQNSKTSHFPGKTQLKTEHNKHYRTLLVRFGKVWFPVGIAAIATAVLITAIVIAQLNATACVSVTSYLGCV
jgi:hypothetical protein